MALLGTEAAIGLASNINNVLASDGLLVSALSREVGLFISEQRRAVSSFSSVKQAASSYASRRERMTAVGGCNAAAIDRAIYLRFSCVLYPK